MLQESGETSSGTKPSTTAVAAVNKEGTNILRRKWYLKLGCRTPRPCLELPRHSLIFLKVLYTLKARETSQLVVEM